MAGDHHVKRDLVSICLNGSRVRSWICNSTIFVVSTFVMEEMKVLRMASNA
jgi:hypothetical protein